MHIEYDIIDTTGGGRGTAEGRASPVLYLALDYMGMVLDFPGLALEAQ